MGEVEESSWRSGRGVWSDGRRGGSWIVWPWESFVVERRSSTSSWVLPEGKTEIEKFLELLGSDGGTGISSVHVSAFFFFRRFPF